MVLREPWKIYEGELFGKGYGIPLWFPEPHRNREVSIGDVGFLQGGSFMPVFNAHEGIKYGDWDLPAGFKAFKLFGELRSSRSRFIPSGHTVFSAGVTTSSAAAEARASEFGGASFNFSVTKERGAMLFVRDDAEQELVMPHKKMANYMSENVDSWASCIDDKTGETRPEDLIFVRGFVKTKAWGVAALSTGHARQAVQISGGYGGATAGVQVTHDKTSSASLDQRWSPEGEVRDHADQCLFLNYYRYKRRLLWLFTVQAGAGPHTLPDDQERDDDTGAGVDGSGDGGGVVVEESQTSKNPDYLDYLFDYIFERSDAQSAIVCDGDIADLTDDQDWPEIGPKLKEFLIERMPEIEVVDGVGMLSQQKAVYRTHFDVPLVDEVPIEIDQTLYDPDIPVAGPSGTSHDDAEPAVAEASGSGELMDTVDASGVIGTNIGGDADEGPELGHADADEPQEKSHPSDSSSVLGKITIGDITVDWPHRQLLDPDDSAESAAIGSVHVSADGEFVGVGYEDGQVRVWNSRKWQLVLRILDQHQQSVTALKFSPDGKRLATAGSQCFVWNIEDARECIYSDVCQLAGLGTTPGEFVWDLDWSPDSQMIATGSSDFKLRLFDANNGTPIRVHDEPRSLVSIVMFTNDGQHLVCTSDNSGYIYNAHSGEQLGMMDGHTGNIWCMSFSSDAKRVITGSEDHTHRIWNVETGEELVTLREHSGPIWSVGFSPDGNSVMAGSYDKTVSVCDSYIGSRKFLLQGRQSTITAGGFSPSGNFIATGSSDGSVKLWDAKEGVQIADLFGHEDHIKSLQFSAKDDNFVTSSDDGTVRVWSIRDILRVY
ncbi:hypothetical protein EIP91_004957 [Steccherinum ochraceum]|uniref:Uncharacterized protein n=1 Tax=Steccherinum ochraceum TaxID=92696 RepID=A0A4R0RN60_9APHY|nr:hypothetical protein EIP91_004957 [Steccherinum ochraceum]